MTLAREVTMARKTWEILRPLETDAETINAQRHLPTQFQMMPPRFETDEILSPAGHRPPHNNILLPNRVSTTESSQTGPPSLFPPQSPTPSPLNIHRPERERFMSDTSTYIEPAERGITPQELTMAQTSPPTFCETPVPKYRPPPRRKSEATVNKPKPRWIKNPFSNSNKKADAPPAHTSGDSSSLSSGALENQRLEEIPLGSLMGSSKPKARASRTIHTYLSPSSTLALFWSQLSMQIWDVGTSPPTMMRGISTESTCILAAVVRTHLAYIIGTRDQKLTVRGTDHTREQVLTNSATHCQSHPTLHPRRRVPHALVPLVPQHRHRPQ